MPRLLSAAARRAGTGRWIIVAALLAVAPGVGACGGDGNATADQSTPRAAISASDAEARLKRIVLTAEDIGGGYTQDVARAQTNEQAASARADTASAQRQYEAWGQALAYNVQYGAPPSPDLIYTGRIARVMNTATIFGNADGASAALAYERTLPAELLQDVVANDGAGTKISETQVTKDVGFPSKGDESFAWRISGTATFEDGFTSAFIADTVFVRVGDVTGTVTAVALGKPPDRPTLERLVDRFVERAAGG